MAPGHTATLHAPPTQPTTLLRLPATVSLSGQHAATPTAHLREKETQKDRQNFLVTSLGGNLTVINPYLARTSGLYGNQGPVLLRQIVLSDFLAKVMGHV